MITAKPGADDEAKIGANNVKTTTKGKKRLKKISDENDDGNRAELPGEQKMEDDAATAGKNKDMEKDKVTKTTPVAELS